jgi:hypothetical protein
MAGTVKLCVPELPEVADFVGVGECVGVADLVGRADLVAAAEALCVARAEVTGVADGPDGEDGLDGADNAVAEAPEAAEDAAVGAFPPIPAHAARPVPATTTAMITARTRHMRICFYPFQRVTRCYR